ncbi:hypothetical protein BACERE00175_01680 [Bacillus cereus]|uniref:hypothetical protein n=1 Tax=Bacillus cereus TaxID=1396 RepID=UPI000A3036F9|nr:hypothetical protein [Bacillus cereus]KAA2400556.1 hypothetical protein F2Y18_07660 [Bacillus cereus]SMD81904.1 hypothetical protein BACERE00175_01680 [Bacillus cereus]
MTKEKYTHQVSFYLSDGKEISGRFTRKEDAKECLKTLKNLIDNHKTISVPNIGTLIRTKYITHVKVVEVKNEND